MSINFDTEGDRLNFCTACGYRRTQGETFCRNCGKVFAGGQQTLPPAPPAPGVYPAQPPPGYTYYQQPVYYAPPARPPAARRKKLTLENLDDNNRGYIGNLFHGCRLHDSV